MNSGFGRGGGWVLYFHSSQQTILFVIKLLQTERSQRTPTCLYYAEQQPIFIRSVRKFG